MIRRMRTHPVRPALLLVVCAVAFTVQVESIAQQGSRGPEHARQYRRLLIRNAMIIYGNAKPPYGPMDIVLQDGVIAEIRQSGGRGLDADAVIDATGKYVMPGIVNTHMHWHEERAAGIPQPIQYERNLYLASGVTTAREVGGSTAKTKQWRDESNAHTIVAPRILLWNRPNLGRYRTPEEIRAGVRQAKTDGFDGLKIGGLDRDQLEALMDEAKKQGLCTTTHIGVEETTAKDYVDLGVCSIEHFYGIGDAAIDGANWLQKIWYVNLPMMRNIIAITALFALSLLGVDPARPELGEARRFVLARLPDGYRYTGDDDFVHRARGNLYFWYYATLALFRVGGAEWELWNTALKETLLPAQAEDGSWRPLDVYSEYAGDEDDERTYTTAMCVLSLEIYYRYFTPLLKVR